MNLIKSYLFVPANNPRFLKKSLALDGLDYRVLDLEDSISASDIDQAINLVQRHSVQETDWGRMPIAGQCQALPYRLFGAGLQQVVLRKATGKKQVGEVLRGLHEISEDIRVIILIENALMFVQLEQVLREWNRSIFGIGLGSHDFSATTKIRHAASELLPLRLQISVMARAYGVTPIDIASMNISDEPSYKAEIQSGYDLGYRAKFVLHPFQLRLLNGYSFFTKEEVADAIEVITLFDQKEPAKEVVVKHKGTIYEKPHIEQLNNIKAWGEQFYGTDR